MANSLTLIVMNRFVRNQPEKYLDFRTIAEMTATASWWLVLPSIFLVTTVNVRKYKLLLTQKK